MRSPDTKCCIVFSTADWNDPYWTNKQHIAVTLANMGWKILYVDSVGSRFPAITSSKDWVRIKLRLINGLRCLFFGAIKRHEGIWVLSILVIPATHNKVFFSKLNSFLLRHLLSKSVRKIGITSPLIWTYHPYLLNEQVRLSRSKIVYHCVDDIASIPGINSKEFIANENKLLEISSIVFATSISLVSKCKMINKNTHFFPNVVDIQHFERALTEVEEPVDLRRIPYPRVVYHGVLSDFKIDFLLIYKCAKLKPNIHWIFIGGEREGQHSKEIQQLKKLKNIYFLGYKKYELLPNYLAYMNVGILPSRINAYTKGMFPMKYFEYIASGLPVVSTGLEFTKIYSDCITICNTAEEFCDGIDEKIKQGKINQKDRLRIIGESTWLDRTKKMLELIQ